MSACEETGAPLAPLGRFAARVIVDVGTGLNLGCPIWIGASNDWFAAPVLGLTAQPCRYPPALLTR